jgi:hypothetical protein
MKSSAYPTLDSLVDLACRDGVDIRPTLLRVLTDLYVQKPAHTAFEETQYVALALGLIDTVDQATRDAVAASLHDYPATPAAIRRKLAAPVSPPRDDAAARTAPEADDLIELFFAASSMERRLILANLDVQTTASRPVSAAGEVIRLLEAAALQRNVGEFSRVLERAIGISRDLAERIARDPFGEPIVVAAKALGMKAAVLQRILLFLNPAIGQSIERVYDLADLFDGLPPQAAEQMLAIWRKTGGRTKGRHEPAYWNDERRSARSLSSPAPRRAARERDDQPARSKDDRR